MARPASSASLAPRRTVVLAVLVAATMFLALPATGDVPVVVNDYPYGFQGEGEARIRDLDARTGTVAVTAAQEAIVRRLGAAATWNDFGTPHTLLRYGGVMSAPADGAPVDVARGWVHAHRDLFRLSDGAVEALEVLRESPLLDSPDLGRVAKGEAPHNPDVATVVLFRQRFGELAAGLDGLLTVGVTAAGEIAWASSSVTGDEAVNGSRRLDAVAAYRIAAGDVGWRVAAADLEVVERQTVEGFTTFRLAGVPDLQYARAVAVPTPTDGVRPAWETVVLHRSPADTQPVAFIHFIDAETGAILHRSNRLDHAAAGEGLTSSSAAAAPSGAPFNGTTLPAACGPDHPFEVTAGNDSIQVTAAAAPNSQGDEDIMIDLLFGGDVVAHQDLLTSPEVLLYTPEGGVAAGTYAVRVCPYNAGAEPISYSGFFSAQPGSTSFPQPRWRVFPANPLLSPPDGPTVPDTREVWCWVPGQGCDRVVGQDERAGSQFTNLASRAPWDFDVLANRPTFTTDGNNASTAVSEASFLTPDTIARRPASPTRNYDFPWTNAWFTSRCDPTNFDRADRNRNDEDAATANLFVMHNRMHDWGYYLGWTERNSTLQKTNFGNTAPGPFPAGREVDPEVGQSQAGRTSPAFTGRDNANQITLQDGIPGITNQYLWQPLQAGFYAPCVDGAYDMAVVAHEVGHAIQNRMTGGPDSGLSGHQARAMGESWSDLTAVEYLNGYGLVPVADESPFAVGAYATGNKVQGIRNYNMSASPLNFSDVEYDGNGTTSPHADGEIWSATHFDIRQRMVERYEAAFPSTDRALQVRCADGELPADRCPGNRRWIQLVHDAFLLQPTATSMVTSRDAVLAADVLRFGGANQDLLWDAFAARGLGDGAASEGPTDLQPTPDFASPVRADNATVRFRAVPVDGGGVPAAMNVYVGVYEARVTPLATTAGGAVSEPRRFVPGTYSFTVQAPGYGAHRFTRAFAPGEDVTLDIPLRRNHASATHGAVATGDGGNHGFLIDDTEATNWASVGDGDIRGKTVVVQLAGGPQVVSQVQVSAALRAADRNLGYDPGGQNRFSALRQFEILTCNARPDVDCSALAQFTSIYTSPADAFPGIRPRPTAPALTLRPFDVPPTQATHVAIRVLNNQCSGNPDYTREANPDNDVINDPDCMTGRAAAGLVSTTIPPQPTITLTQAENVRIAELQVFSQAAPAVSPPAQQPPAQQPSAQQPPAQQPPAQQPPAQQPPAQQPTQPSGGSQPQGTETSTDRVSGPNRIATAIMLSQSAFTQAPRAVLARADAFPDALASATLAVEIDGPVLLTARDRLDPQVAEELRRLGTTEVYLAGGTAALSSKVADDLAAMQVTPTRVGGVDRFETASKIADEVVRLGGAVTRAIVARADDFPDALAASNVAAAGRAPILLTPSHELHPTTAAALRRLLAATRPVHVAGGTAAVSLAVEEQIRAAGFTAGRVSGANRFETAVALAREARTLGAGTSPVVLASGATFPDALAAGPAAAQRGGILLLVDPSDLERSPATRAYLTANADRIQQVVVAGGRAAISDRVAEAAAAAAGAG